MSTICISAHYEAAATCSGVSVVRGIGRCGRLLLCSFGLLLDHKLQQTTATMARTHATPYLVTANYNELPVVQLVLPFHSVAETSTFGFCL